MAHSNFSFPNFGRSRDSRRMISAEEFDVDANELASALVSGMNSKLNSGNVTDVESRGPVPHLSELTALVERAEKPREAVAEALKKQPEVVGQLGVSLQPFSSNGSLQWITSPFSSSVDTNMVQAMQAQQTSTAQANTLVRMMIGSR